MRTRSSSARIRLFSMLLPLGIGLAATDADAAVPASTLGAVGVATSPAETKADKKSAKKSAKKAAKKPGKKKAKKKARKNGKSFGGAKGKGKHRAAICGALTCTEAQREQVALILDGVRQTHRKSRDAGRALHTSLAREMAKSSPSKKELARVRKELDRHRDAADDRMFDALLEVHALLDDRQRKQLSSMIETQGLRRVLLGGRGGHGPKRKGARDGRGRPPMPQGGPDGPPARAFGR